MSPFHTISESRVFDKPSVGFGKISVYVKVNFSNLNFILYFVVKNREVRKYFDGIEITWRMWANLRLVKNNWGSAIRGH